MVGRDDARRRVADALRSRGDRTLVVHGPAGIGKSRLVEEALVDADPATWRVRASRPLRATPLGALALAAPEAVAGAADRHGLVQSLLASVEAAPPPAIWVDDAHHLDAESATVVFHLVQRDLAPVVLTVRDGEDPPAAVATLRADADRSLRLGPLDEVEVEQLTQHLLEGHLAAPSLRRLHRRSGGNPLLLRELVRSGVASGAIAERGGVWHVSERATAEVGLEDLVADHALGVGPSAAELFRHLAVADHLPEPAALRLPGAAAESVDELVLAGLIARHDQPELLRPAHPLFAEVVASRLRTDERRAIAGRLAVAVEEAGLADEEARAVRWRLEAGLPLETARATTAAWAALGTFDLDLARDAADVAVAGGDETAHLPLATALAYAGRHDEAVPHFERAIEAITEEWPRAFASVTATLNRAYLEGWGRWTADAHRAGAATLTDPGMVVFLRSEEASALAFAGFLDEAVELAAPELTDPTVDPLRALPFVPGWSSARTAQGQTGEVVRELARLEAAIGEAPSRAHAWLFVFRGQAEAVHGNLDEAARAMERFEQLAYLTMVEDVAAVLRSEMRGLIHLWRGEVDSAVRWLREATALSEVPESRFRRTIPWGHLAQARALAGDGDGAASALEEAQRAASLLPLGAGYAHQAVGWERYAAGDLTGAGRAATDAATWCAERGLVTAAMWCAVDALRFAPSSPAAAAVDQLARRADGAWAEAFAAHAAGVADREGSVLLDAADRYEAIGASLHAAEVLELAATRLRAVGRRDPAGRAAARAEAARARCESAAASASTATDDPAVASLSNRERQVAALVATGLTNAEVAERLSLSVRTTEGHLARAMAKLDVSRRTDLADRLG